MSYTIKNSLSDIATDPVRNFKYVVNIPHTIKGVNIGFTLGFTAVSGLSVTTNSIPYRQGGYNTTVQQIPGQSTFSPVTFQRGMLLGTQQEWDWMRQLFSVNVGGGDATAKGDFRSTVDIQVLKHPTVSATAPIVAAFRLYNAWPTAVSFSDLNAGDNAFIVSQMTLVHEGFDVRTAASGDASFS